MIQYALALVCGSFVLFYTSFHFHVGALLMVSKYTVGMLVYRMVIVNYTMRYVIESHVVTSNKKKFHDLMCFLLGT